MKSSVPVILIFLIACSACKRKNNIAIDYSYPHINNGNGKLICEEINNEINLQSDYNNIIVKKNTGVYNELIDNEKTTLYSKIEYCDAKELKGKTLIRPKRFYYVSKTYCNITFDTKTHKKWVKEFIQSNIHNILSAFPISIQNINLIQKGFSILNEQSINKPNQQKLLGNLGKKIKEQKLLLFIFTITIILILAFAVLLYTFSKQKYKYIKLVEEQNNQISQHLKEEQALSEELAHKNDALELYKNELELLVKDRTSNLEIALKKAEESDNLKSSFLSNFSHEVRTPLNSIIGFSNLLTREESKTEDRKLFLNHIKSSGRQLLKLIEDLVEASIVNTENIKINHHEISIKHLLNETFELYKIENAELLNQKESSVKFTLNTSEDRIVKTDFHRIRQLLGYLIDNAIKFTHKGNVELGWINKNNKVRIYVKDSGIGIDSKNFENIFKKFVKLEEDISVLYRGTGIGLNIAQRLATFLHTNIHIESVLEKGSVFYFDLTLTFNSTPQNSLQSTFNKAKNTNN